MKPNRQFRACASVKNEAVENLFQQKSLIERLGPVLDQLLSYLRGEKTKTQGIKPLPEYCYTIFKALRKTQFRVLPDSPEFGVAGNEMDWEFLGKTMGAGLRCLRFEEFEKDGLLKREGLSPEEIGQLSQTIAGLPGWSNLKGGGKAHVKGSDELWAAYLGASQSAWQCGGDSLAVLTGAMEKGIEGFLDEDGRCVVEHARDNIYWFLLLVWPEIQAMQRAEPPITRKEFAEWIEPFADAGLVSIRDLDQLLDVCDDIGLKFKGRGAPRKK